MSKFSRILVPALIGVAVLAVTLNGKIPARDSAKAVPAPLVDEPAGSQTSEIAVLAGGCFWGVQGVYQHVKGVTNALSGYAGGAQNTAEYERVSGGSTGHAESVQVTFDPRVITYGKVLQIFFSVVHDPTQLNRQGPDVGTQYRSAIFPANADQANVAQAYIAQLNQARVFNTAIATKIEPGRAFYPAEGYHQDYYARNASQPYCRAVIAPKVAKLRTKYFEKLKV